MRVGIVVSCLALVAAACSNANDTPTSEVVVENTPPSRTERVVTWPETVSPIEEAPVKPVITEPMDEAQSEALIAEPTLADEPRPTPKETVETAVEMAEAVQTAPAPAKSSIIQEDVSLKGEPSAAEAQPTPTLAEEILALPTYPLAYETPTAGKINEPFQVTLAIDGTGDTTAVDALPGEEMIIENTAQLSRVVEATLSGAAFDIKLTSKDRQMLSPLRESIWRWSVTPLREGSHNLFLDVHAVLGNDESVLLDSFADQISVTVSAPKKASFLGLSPEDIRTYVGIIAGLFSAILGGIALIGFLRKKETKPRVDDVDR